MLTIAASQRVLSAELSALGYHKFSGQESTRAYDQCRFEGLKPKFEDAIGARFAQLSWSDDMTEDANSIIATNLAAEDCSEEWSRNRN